MTSGLYRTETSIFLLSDFGRPRRDFNGTISASCFLVSGRASGSALAAERIRAFSAGVGIRISRLGMVFDIVFDLFAFCISETDDSSDFASVDKRNVIERIALRHEADHSDFIVFESGVDPHQRFCPNQLLCKCQGQIVLSAIQFVFGGVKVDQHTIL